MINIILMILIDEKKNKILFNGEEKKNLIWKIKMGKKDNGLWIDD